MNPISKSVWDTAILLVGGTKIGVLTEENEIKEPIDEFEKLPWFVLVILKVLR